jgi:long-subunit fatty acid transport protein
VRGLGVGAGLSVPYARGGSEYEEPSAGRWTLRDGGVQAAALQAGVGWEFDGRFAVGATGGVLLSAWTARVDNDTMPDIDHAIAELGQESGYTDEDLEDPEYATTLQFDTLRDAAFLWSVGGQAEVLPRVGVALAFVSSVRLQNEGAVQLQTGCPPQSDTIGRFGIESLGLCDASLEAAATVAYPLPWRLHGGVELKPDRDLRVNLMGGFVKWSLFQDYDITIAEVAARNPSLDEEAVALIEQQRQWARSNEDSVWGGVDVKWRPVDEWTLGGRVLHDRAAVPDRALSGNNYDANDWIVGFMAAVRPVGPLEFGLTYSHHFLETRVVDDSAFGMTLVEGEQAEDRWFYPHSNGSYSGGIHRLGLSVAGHFGRAKKVVPKGREELPRAPR